MALRLPILAAARGARHTVCGGDGSAGGADTRRGRGWHPCGRDFRFDTR